MAFTTLVSLERTIDQILNDDRFSISPHEREQLISLDKFVISFQAFLEDFPVKAKTLESRMWGVAAEAEDIIEWFMLELIKSSSRYSSWIAILRGVKFRCQLHKVSNEMDSIAGEVMELKSSITVKDAQCGDSCGSSSAFQVADTEKTNVVDSNPDLVEIQARLYGPPLQLQVLPIFGMGGIGKTTLARSAYYHKQIIEHFDIRAWVTVSQDYSERRILLELLDIMKEFDTEQRNESVEKMAKRSENGKESPLEIFNPSDESLEKIHELSNSEIAVKVHKILTERRFLIVMDNMWSAKVLDDVKHLFPNDKNGSRIMLTTRLTEIATHAKSSIPSYEMRLMDADQSWTLLKQKVKVPPELESTGREIARSCGGLPLAIVVIAGILSSVTTTPASWNEIAKHVKQSLASLDRQMEKILSLSFTHLPHHLRPCFLYLGGFPEDHEIRVTELTRLWIAEGFVKPTVSKRFEGTAEEYLEELVNRTLIIIKKRKSNGKIKSCSLHDIVREMCIKLSQEEKFLVQVKGRPGVVTSMKDDRRISISHSYFNSFPCIFNSTIRTLLYFQDELGSFGSLRLVRVLDVRRVRIDYPLIHDQIFKLFHLRYLAFHCFDSISRGISNLQSLETLIIKGSFSQLPSEIWNMPQLRHLISTGSSLPDPEGATSALQALQTLDVSSLKCSINTINMIPNLKKLNLRYILLDQDLLFHNLVHLRLLEELHLELGYRCYHPRVVSNHVFPISLKKLTLIRWGYQEKYMNIVGSFPNLEVLKLKRFNFQRREWRSTGEDFPQLKYLLIEYSNLRQWNVEGNHFPRLKELLIHFCPKLSEIPDGVRDAPTLELIELKKCRKSLVESVEQIQEDSQDYGNDELQVRCIDCYMDD